MLCLSASELSSRWVPLFAAQTQSYFLKGLTRQVVLVQS